MKMVSYCKPTYLHVTYLHDFCKEIFANIGKLANKEIFANIGKYSVQLVLRQGKDYNKFSLIAKFSPFGKSLKYIS